VRVKTGKKISLPINIGSAIEKPLLKLQQPTSRRFGKGSDWSLTKAARLLHGRLIALMQ
jgi:hypothetical protein